MNAYEMIMQQIQKAQGSKGYFAMEKFYEALGMLRMARNLNVITVAEFLELDKLIVRWGINNPEYFD